MNAEGDSVSGEILGDAARAALWARLEALPVALRPPHPSDGANDPITLYTGPFELRQGPHRYAVDGGLAATWEPTPRIRFSGRVQDDVFLLNTDLPLKVDVPGTSRPVSAYYGDFSYTIGAANPPVSGRLAETLLQGSQSAVDTIRFGVSNFHGFSGIRTRFSQPDGLAVSSRLQLTSDRWHFTLDEQPNFRDLEHAAKERAGYAIGHAGKLRRATGRTISVASAQAVLDGVFNFLAFCRGLWVGPVLPVGFRKDEEIWSMWGLPKLSRRVVVSSWFPNRYTGDLDPLFRGFMQRWEDDDWNPVCWFAINWYVEANHGSGGIEGSIILSQTALEMMAWVVLVEEAGTFTGNQFRSLPAHSRIIELLKHVGISTATPRNLRSAARTLGASSGPEVLTGLRNALIHSRLTKRQKVLRVSIPMRNRILDLGQWYLELVLLRWFGYSGRYRSRLSYGDYRPMPTP